MNYKFYSFINGLTYMLRKEDKISFDSKGNSTLSEGKLTNQNGESVEVKNFRFNSNHVVCSFENN